MKFTITDLHKKIAELPGIYGIYLNEDLVINKDLNIYMKERPVGKTKPHLKLDERVLIHTVDLLKIAPRIAQDATVHIFAVHDVVFKNIPENFDKHKDFDNHAAALVGYRREYEEYVKKYYKEIKDHAELIKLQAIKALIVQINTPILRQILWSFGYKDADAITTIDSNTGN